MRNFIIVEKTNDGRDILVKGMTFSGYEAAIKTCIRLSSIHKDKKYFVYDRLNKVQYHITQLPKELDQPQKGGIR